MKTTPHLIVRLKKGWRFEESTGCFVCEDGEQVEDVSQRLPGGRAQYRVPLLARKDPETLSEEEVELLRHFTFFLPAGMEPSEGLQRVQRWPCVEKVELPPKISLPSGFTGMGPVQQTGE